MLLNFVIDKDGFRCTNASDILNTDYVSYVKCHFDFKIDSWKSVTSVIAIFKSATYNETAEVLLDVNNDCYIDPEVYKRGGVVLCKLVGDRYKSTGEPVSSSHITNITSFKVNDSITLPTPIPSKYDVFVAELELAQQAVLDAINEISAAAERGDFDGDQGVGIRSVTYNADGTVTITLTDDTTFTSAYSMKGEPGDDGADGVGIETVTYGEDGKVTVTLSNGTSFTSQYSMRGPEGPRGPAGNVEDVYINGSSIVNTDGKANIPIATASQYGVTKIKNAFSNVKVGSTTIASDTETDTLELVAGVNVSLTPDASNDKITINAEDTVYTGTAPISINNNHAISISNASASAAGAMSAADKLKLDSIPNPPSTDGSYLLNAVVTNGVAILGWIPAYADGTNNSY